MELVASAILVINHAQIQERKQLRRHWTLDVIQIVLIILKLVGVINWSWWVVLIPMWITIGMWVLFIIIMCVNELQYRKKPAKHK